VAVHGVLEEVLAYCGSHDVLCWKYCREKASHWTV
jgi:hypothetical protein